MGLSLNSTEGKVQCGSTLSTLNNIGEADLTQTRKGLIHIRTYMSGKPFVPVVGNDGKPLMPCTGKRARLLLTRKRARVYRYMPFTIQLLDRSQSNCHLQPLQLKIDPGSRGTGIAIVRDCLDGSIKVVSLMEIAHRGITIRNNLIMRAMFRRRRRSSNLRYRKPRFLNRTKPKGWLAPSLMHSVHTTMTWVKRIMKNHPISTIHVESVKFDTHKLRHPDIQGEEYQHGTLFKYEVKEYLLDKWNRKCAYCDTSNVTRFTIDHVVPRARGGSNSVSNLVLACMSCNMIKGSNTLESFLQLNKPRILRIKKQLRTPLNDAAAMNSTRNRLLKELNDIGLPVYTYTGAQTKHNRVRLSIPKSHALDAACVGNMTVVRDGNRPTMIAKATGHGTYQRTLTDKYGFPRLHRARIKTSFGFSTGDIVRGSNRGGVYKGRLTTRQKGDFSLLHGKLRANVIYKNCHLLQKNDGYHYYLRPASEHETTNPIPM